MRDTYILQLTSYFNGGSKKNAQFLYLDLCATFMRETLSEEFFDHAPGFPDAGNFVGNGDRGGILLSRWANGLDSIGEPFASGSLIECAVVDIGVHEPGATWLYVGHLTEFGRFVAFSLDIEALNTVFVRGLPLNRNLIALRRGLYITEKA